MRLNKVTLSNFRQFEGQHVIEFSTSREKSITLIKGNNGSGKTTLIQAMNFCFFGERLTNLPDNRKLLSYSFYKAKRPSTTKVSIDFEHEGNKYLINRARTHDHSGNTINVKKDIFEGFVTSKKGTIEITEDRLRDILPEKVSYYFFFDGERIQNISDRVGRKQLSADIVRILGLDLFSKSLELLRGNKLNTVESMVSAETVIKNDEVAELQNNRFNRSIALEKEQINNDELTEKLEKTSTLLEDVRKELSNTENVKAIHAQRESKERENRNLREQINSTQKEIILGLRETLPAYIASYYAIDIMNLFRQLKIDNKDLPGINAAAIDAILEKQECVCGTPLLEGSKERITLENWKNFLPPKNLSSLIIDVKQNINSSSNESKKVKQDSENRYAKILRLRESINKNEQEINDISKKISSLPDTSSLEKNLQQLLAKRDELQYKRGISDKTLDDLNKIVSNIDRKLDEAISQMSGNELVKDKLNLIEIVNEIIKKEFVKKESEARNNLQKYVNEFYPSIIQKDFKIVFNEDYSFKVFNNNHDEVTETLSEGEKIVTSFTFVGALIKTAMDQNIEVFEFPIVMDAPFAKLDNEHRRKVARFIKNLGNQVVIITADSQWIGEIENELGDYIGNSYEMKFDKDLEKTTILGGVR
jgi:DNA sulfur modification protein DndD